MKDSLLSLLPVSVTCYAMLACLLHWQQTHAQDIPFVSQGLGMLLNCHFCFHCLPKNTHYTKKIGESTNAAGICITSDSPLISIAYLLLFVTNVHRTGITLSKKPQSLDLLFNRQFNRKSQSLDLLYRKWVMGRIVFISRHVCLFQLANQKTQRHLVCSDVCLKRPYRVEMLHAVDVNRFIY